MTSVGTAKPSRRGRRRPVDGQARTRRHAAPDAVALPLVPDSRVWRKMDLAGGWTAWVMWYGGFAGQEATLQAVLNAADGSETALIAAARKLAGHGALLAHKDGVALGMTDVVASVPLYCAGARIAADGRDLVKAAGLGGIDQRSALQIALAGYTVGRRTLTPGLEALKPGEIVVVDALGRRHLRYARYVGEPDEAIDPADPQVMAQHNAMLLGLIEQLARDAGGRTIAVPLSGGLDSRAIASGLKLVGYDKVLCFSYGLPDNHEASGAQRVAKRLGYPWRFVGYEPKSLRAFFTGETAQRFFTFADRPDAMPFMQDVPAIERLRHDGLLPEDAIIVNGQSGDYIAGNHIPAAIGASRAPERLTRDALFHAIRAKHFDLWAFLETPAAVDAIKADVLKDLGDCVGDSMTRKDAVIAYELSEFENRQSKYVVAGQRCYEMFGYEWRLPLWEPALVEYWRRMPLAAKFGRRLFQSALEAANWCGVWGADWRFSRTVVPSWLRPLRLGVKALLAPAGKDVWHRAEKHVFEWRADPIQNYAIAPYRRVLFDRRGFRNALSWHAEAYLARHGVSLDALAAGAD